jgi:choline/glycine/proline betaine transport protein
VMILICYGLLRALQLESAGVQMQSAQGAAPVVTWQHRLNTLLFTQDRRAIESWIAEAATPALTDIAGQIRSAGHDAQVRSGRDRVELLVTRDGHDIFHYSVRARGYRAPTFSFTQTAAAEDDQRHYHAVVHCSHGDQNSDVTGLTRDQLITDFLSRFAQFSADTKFEARGFATRS